MTNIFVDGTISESLRMMLTERLKVVSVDTEADIVVTADIAYSARNKLVVYITSEPFVKEAVYVDCSLDVHTQASLIENIVKASDIKDKIYADTQLIIDSNYRSLFSKFHAILNSMPECMVQVDREGTILFSNTKFLETYGAEIYDEPTNLFELFDTGTAKLLIKKLSSFVNGEVFEFNGTMVQTNGDLINISGNVTDLPGHEKTFEVMFEDVTEKMANLVKMRKEEKQAILAGFSRHISHNVINALTAAGGFIRQIKAKTENNMLTQNLWQIIEGKLGLIEEIVAAYNDYTHSLTLKAEETTVVADYLADLMGQISSKEIDRRFSAHLYKYVDSYNLDYDASDVGEPFACAINPLFLKLGICYLIKDNIRYFGTGKPLQYKVKSYTENGKFYVRIDLDDVQLTEAVAATMYKPWDHQIQSQSYDYWGIMIASTIMERHNGSLTIVPYEGGVRFNLVFNG